MTTVSTSNRVRDSFLNQIHEFGTGQGRFESLGCAGKQLEKPHLPAQGMGK
jgi:hypothetical protein